MTTNWTPRDPKRAKYAAAPDGQRRGMPTYSQNPFTNESAYTDAAYQPRPCDRCGKTYQRPAVYCSLACAIADA